MKINDGCERNKHFNNDDFTTNTGPFISLILKKYNS